MFALVLGKFVTRCCRADNIRPYIRNRKHSDKLKFEVLKEILQIEAMAFAKGFQLFGQIPAGAAE